MLDPDWPATPLVLWAALAGLVALLTVRAIRRDRSEYRRFKRLRLTAKRQAMLLRWLRDSALTLGGSAVLLLALSWQFVEPLLTEIQSWFGMPPWLGWVIVLAAVVGLGVLTIVGILALRRSNDEVMMVGDIRAMLPRNRQEIRIGWWLSINAGVSEELVFRLAVPATLYGASGSAIVAVVGSILLFGALHLYQGVTGITASTLLGAAFFFAYVATGTILVPIVLHALVDLRSFVLLPTVAYGAHRIDGRTQPRISLTRVRADASAPEASPVTEPAPDASPVE